MTSSITNKRGFSLIELLTVIVIIGMLLVIAVPVMSRLTRSNALNSALRQVSNSAALSRQYAITHRVNTELRITNTCNAVTVLTNGVQIDKWDYFPPGVYVDPATSVTSVTFKPTGGTFGSLNQQIVIREAASTNSAGVVGLVGTNDNFGVITVSYILGKATVSRP